MARSTPSYARGDVDEARRLTRGVTLLSVGLAVTLTAVKLAVWLGGGSVAMLASLADSGLDVVAALATFAAVRYAAAPPDAEHRFGHGKAEAFSSLLQAALVIASAALIGREAGDRLLHPRPSGEQTIALVVMIGATLATIALVMVQNRVLARVRSVAIQGDRAHYVADLASNILVLVGLGLVRLTGEPRFDAAAGLAVALWLVWGAVKVLRDAADHLMDRELDEAERQAIVDCVLTDPAVRGVHELRTRASGPMLYIQMHMDLDPEISLQAAHHIVAGAETRLLEAFPAADILIHPDPQGCAEPHGPFGEEGRRYQPSGRS